MNKNSTNDISSVLIMILRFNLTNVNPDGKDMKIDEPPHCLQWQVLRVFLVFNAER